MMGSQDRQDASSDKVLFLENAPGIAIQYDASDPGQEGFVLFVKGVIAKLASLQSNELGALGAMFLKEFDPDRAENKGLCLPDLQSRATLLIRPPLVVSPNAVKIAVAETKGIVKHLEKKQFVPCPQAIETWWPGSENSNLRKGIKFLIDVPSGEPEPLPASATIMPPAAWKEEKIKLTGKVEKLKLDPQYRPKTSDKSVAIKAGEFFYYGQMHTFEIALIHEMIHAFLGLRGKSRSGTGGSDSAEEKMVVGICEHVALTYTENKFRALLGMPPRTDYKSLQVKDDKAQTWAKTFETW